jgi:hypothetical protein
MVVPLIPTGTDTALTIAYIRLLLNNMMMITRKAADLLEETEAKLSFII